MLSKSMVPRVDLDSVASEFERVDGRKFLIPNEVFTAVPTPLGVLALLLGEKREQNRPKAG